MENEMSYWLLQALIHKVIREVLQPIVDLFQALSCYWKCMIHLLRKQKLHTKEKDLLSPL